MYLARPSKTLWCGVESLALSEGVPGETAAELEGGEPQTHAAKSLLILSGFEFSFAPNSFSRCQLRLCANVTWFSAERIGSTTSRRRVLDRRTCFALWTQRLCSKDVLVLQDFSSSTREVDKTGFVKKLVEHIEFGEALVLSSPLL